MPERNPCDVRENWRGGGGGAHIGGRWFNGPNFRTADDFCDYLESTLIPDLFESGNDATAEDFQEAVYWIRGIAAIHTAKRDFSKNR